ncbi:MAG: diadenylate cyclase CdaA [Chthoniobacterales bacterium]
MIPLKNNVVSLVAFLGDHWTSGLEILILATLLYYSYLSLKRIPGAQILIWVTLTFFTLTFISQELNLVVLSWLLKSISAFLVIAIVIIFQPELRRALNELGIHRFFTSALQHRETIEELTEIVFDLSNKGFGALIALEGDMDLKTIVETGVKLDAVLSKELILTLFHPKTLLHDGGVIIGNDRIVGAGCIFPLSQRDDLDRTIGLRHRAGLGLSEEFDTIVLVVSEETGYVSLCYRGSLERHLNEQQFRERLSQLIIPDNAAPTSSSLERKTMLPIAGSSPLVPDLTKHRPNSKDIDGEM